MRTRLFVLLLSVSLWAYFDTLDIIGHIPGAACSAVEYSNHRLYAGAGSSLFIYNCEDPADMEYLGHVNFSSLVTNIVVRYDSMVFVGANHDGLYAVDCADPAFPVVAKYIMPDHDHWISDLELSPPDTLWLSDYKSLKKMVFTGDTFLVEDEYLSGSIISGAGFRDTLVAVCRRGVVTGFVDLYNRAHDDFIHITSFDSARLSYVVDAEFADNRDDIIYVMGGSPNLGVDGDFYALQYDDSLYLAAGHKFHGVPLLAQTYIGNMDSRNDTLYLATMAAIAWDETPLGTTCPVLDGTCLPDSMPIRANFVPGLWFFDVALHDEHPALATASEWFGVLWTEIDDYSSRMDTIRTYATGGWGQHSYLYGGDTLFIAMEGYGVGIFDVRDPSEPERIARIQGSFAHDLFFHDSILVVARGNGYFYNLAPLWRGGAIEFLDTFDIPLVFGETHACLSFSKMETTTDTFLILPISDDGVNFIEPSDIPGVIARYHFYDNTSPEEICCFAETMFVMMKDSFHVARFTGDTIESIFDCATPGEALGLYRNKDFLAFACKGAGVFWYEWTVDSLIEIGSWNPWGNCLDIEYFDSLLYVVAGGEGLYILNIDRFPEIDTLAWFPGSGGWEFLQYGSQHISFGPDSTIYLTDYHAACYILESFKRDPFTIPESNIPEPTTFSISTHPNPFNSAIRIEINDFRGVGANKSVGDIKIYDISGRLVTNLPVPSMGNCGKDEVHVEGPTSLVWHPDKSLGSGIYLIRAKWDKGTPTTKRVVYIK